MNAKQLKNAILQLAIQGKLVPQDATDEPASALLAQIRKEKEQLVKAGKLKKKDLETTPITDEEKPFEIPESWEWVRLGEYSDIITGSTPSKLHPEYYGIDYPFYKPSELDQGINVCKSVDGLSKVGFESTRKTPAGSVLVTCIGATIGKTGLITKDGSCNQQINAILPSKIWFSKLLFYFCNSSYFQNLMRANAAATTLPIMNKSNFSEITIPLPPLAEQHRIVAKIEELMPLVEEYGEAQEKLNQLNEALPEALKKSILQQAIQGKLVPQDANDEPASALLAQIRKEKEQLVKAGKLKPACRQAGKKDLETTPISDEEKPFEIPESWEWCRLDNVTYSVGSKENQIQTKDILKIGNYCVVSQGQNLIDGYSNEEEKVVYDIPLVMFGDHTRNVKYVDFPFIIGADGTKFHKCIKINAKYLFYWMLFVSQKLRNRGYARHYSLLKQEIIPLPPLAEQQRIVAKIEELMALVDGMK